MIKDTIKVLFSNINELFYNKAKFLHRFFDQLPFPIMGIEESGSVVYCNIKYKQHIGFYNNKVLDTLSFSESVRFENKTYTKRFLYLLGKTTFYLINIEEHDVKNNDYLIPYFVLNTQGKIIEANDAFYKFLQVSKKEIKSSFYSYLNQVSMNLLIQNFTKHSFNNIEIKFSSSEETAALLSKLYKDKSGNYHCSLIDITEYKNLEMHLIHSQKMQAIGQLAGGIAHDFNNLLTAMLGFCDLLLMRHPAGDPSFAEIMQIKQNSNRAANLVRQLLAISRKQVMKSEIIDVSDLIEELVYLIRRLVGEKITLNITHGRGLGVVKADQGQLEQVIINLVVNARDAIFAHSDSGTISITTKNIDINKDGEVEKDLISPDSKETILPGSYVLIEVRDTGTGMTKDTISKIFEPFFSTKELGAGTGLGLSTVYGIVKQTGGYLYVSSKKNHGTKFCIFLKMSDDNDAGDGEMLQESENKLIKQDLTGDATILLVEDEVPVRMFSASALSNKGYHIIEAGSGEEGLKLIKEKGSEIDVVITDVIMPGLNGPDFIAEVHKTHPETKVIFMSGYAEEAFSKTYGLEEDWRFNFLSKPFTLKQLASKVKEVLQEE